MPLEPPASASTPAKRPRGRPRRSFFTEAEAVNSVEIAAKLLQVAPARVLAALEVPEQTWFPGAVKGPVGWRIPKADLDALLGPGLPKLLTVEQFSALLGFSNKWVYELISKGVIKHRRVLGFIRIPATEYWSVPSERPACITPRPSSFFSEEVPAE